uniref:Protein TSSC4 n=1 Tax=Panagrellus redivivus TaxID=6233 RepID=A0A7E4WBU4_PANRE
MTKSVPEKEALVTPSADDEQREMDFFEFIKTVDRDSSEVKKYIGASGSLSSVESQANGNSAVPALHKAASVEGGKRKLSEEGTSRSILKPALRMKAFCGRRQETFHSLEVYAADQQEESTSPSHDDVLKMPAIESLRISTPAKDGRGHLHKAYHKINSDPALAGLNRVNKKSNMTLHTVVQPDGGTLGFHSDAKSGVVVPPPIIPAKASPPLKDAKKA